MPQPEDTAHSNGEQLVAEEPRDETSRVEHLPEDGRFRIADGSGGHDVAVLEYDDRTPGVWDLHHTWTDPARRGRGLADQVVHTALDAARTAGVRVVPTCSYVADWLSGHPDYQDLVAARP
jgi:predicted GNAT family acetyltransferase